MELKPGDDGGPSTVRVFGEGEDVVIAGGDVETILSQDEAKTVWRLLSQMFEPKEPKPKPVKAAKAPKPAKSAKPAEAHVKPKPRPVEVRVAPPIVRREYSDDGGCVMADPRDLLASMPGYGQTGRFVSPAELYARTKEPQ